MQKKQKKNIHEQSSGEAFCDFKKSGIIQSVLLDSTQVIIEKEKKN